MPARIRGPQVVVLSGEDCLVLNGLLVWAVVELTRRQTPVPPRATQVLEEVRRAAIEFRENALANPGFATTFDDSGFVTRASGVTEVLTVAETARVLGVSEQFVRRLAARGVLKGRRCGRAGAWELSGDSVALLAAERNRSKAA